MTQVTVQGYPEARKDLPLFEDFARRMDAVRQRAFENFEKRGFEPGRELEDWVTAEHDVLGWPSAELREKDSEYEMDVTLPGFTPADVEVTATPGEVLVHACAEHRQASGDQKVVWSEISNSEVFRRFVLPHSIEPAAVTAQLNDGVLRVHAPRSRDALRGAAPNGVEG